MFGKGSSFGFSIGASRGVTVFVSQVARSGSARKIRECPYDVMLPHGIFFCRARGRFCALAVVGTRSCTIGAFPRFSSAKTQNRSAIPGKKTRPPRATGSRDAPRFARAVRGRRLRCNLTAARFAGGWSSWWGSARRFACAYSRALRWRVE